MGIYRIGGFAMSKLIEKLEWVAEWGGTKKDIVCLILSGISLLLSIFGVPMPVNPAWVAIILCGVPIVLEAVIGLITAFDIKADVLVLRRSASERILPPVKWRSSCSSVPCLKI